MEPSLDFTQVLNLGINLKYMYFTRILPFSVTTFWRQILFFLLNCIYLTTLVTGYSADSCIIAKLNQIKNK